MPVEGYQAFVARLLQDPAEIWRHAFEQRISEAGRSLLLTLFSFGGRMGDSVLREGFAELHTHRAQTYGLPRPPDDYTRARAELHGAFVRPTASDSIEFINPSVQDWLNRVVRQSPENAVDLIIGAARFTQIAQVWNFVQSAVGGTSRDTLRSNIVRLAPKIEALAAADRAIRHTKGVSYLSPSYEERLATLIRMADTLRAPALLPAIDAVIARIKLERSETLCDIEETVAAVNAYDKAGWDELERFEPFFDDCVNQLAASAEYSCGSNELRALLEQYEDSTKPNHPFKVTLKKAFDGFVADYLSDEIRNCQSGQDFDGLIDHLEYFGRTFGVDVDYDVSRVREAQDEYVDYEEQRADQQMDEYRESKHIERVSDDGIREMFGSLRSER